jgi:AcrR family transcriptional regulator
VPRQGLDRARVVDAASAIADADGLAAVTLARGAAELGVRSPSLYNHVDGRDGLLRELAVRSVRELTAALREAAVGRAGDDALAAIAHAYRAYAHARPGGYATTLAAPAPGDAEHAAAGAEAIAVIVAALRGWPLEGEEEIHAVRGIRSALHGFVALEAAGGFGLPTDLDASFERLVDVLAAGLRVRVGS